MRSMLTIALAIAVCGAVTQAQMVTLDDFEAYTVGESIHGKGIDQTDLNPGVDVPAWYVNPNTGLLYDPGFSIVAEAGGNKMLHNRINQAITEPLVHDSDVIYAVAMSMELNQIDDYGIIYLRYAAESTGSSLVLTNDLEAGWDYDNIAGGEIGTDGWQEGCSGEGYSKMGVIAGLYTDNGFFARDGGGYYTDATQNVPNQEWIELWILIDHPNDRSQYYRCVQGGTPVQMLDELGDAWWGMRNELWDNNAVQNLRFMMSGWGFDTYEHNLYIDTIGVEQIASLAALETAPLNMVGPELLPSPFGGPVCNPGDADGDLDVDLDDFVLLKNNFGTTTGADCSMGDFDGDGDVDLDDFVLLKNNFGMTY